MPNQRTQLRHILATRSGVLAPGIYDGLSAALLTRAGFQVGYMSGAAAAAALGLPDLGLVTQTEMAAKVSLLAGGLEVPLVADADTGFGDVTHTYRTIQLYEAAGAAGIQLEDQEFPKRCGHLSESHVVPVEEFEAKIEAAVAARRDPDTVIIARTDSRAELGFDEAVRRLNRYADAGADALFLEAPRSREEILSIPALLSKPALFNIVPRGKSPEVSLAELAAAGYGLVIVPALAVGPASAAIRQAFARAAAGELDLDGQDSPRELFEIVGLSTWEARRGRFDVEAARA